ncbi:hypothetical protein KCU71_g4147, partial [Aureobasidium melanogenum]
MNASTLGWDDIFFFPFPSLLIFSYTGQPYLKVTMLSPIASSTLQATAIAATSNVIAQLLEQRSKPTASGFSVPDFLRFVIFTLLTAPPNYLWQHALERVFPGRKPLNPTKTILPHYEIREHDNLSGEDRLQQQEEPETKLDWKNTMIKWFIDCMTLGALLNTGVFIIIMVYAQPRLVNRQSIKPLGFFLSMGVPDLALLPPEILGAIIAHCRDDDLPNLRLTCKVINNASTLPSGRRRLAHRCFIFTKHSLQGLVDLTAHSVLGPCVRSISLGTSRLGFRETIEPSTLNDRAPDSLAKKQHDFMITGSHLVMLAMALQNLKAHGHQSGITLGIHDELDGKRGYGFQQAYGETPPDVHEAKSAMFSVLNASWMAGVKPAALNIDLTDDADSLKDDAHSLKDVLSNECLKNFITIDSGAIDPQMDVCIKFNLTADDDQDQIESCSICRVTSGTRLELERLEIFSSGLNPTFNEDFYKNIYRALQRTPIADLSIASFWTDTGDFMELLESWQKTLRHLRISCCGVHVRTITSGFAAGFFKHIKDHLELETLELHSMMMLDGPCNRHTLFEAPVKWQGKEQIREGLDEAIRELDELNGEKGVQVVI